jgi:conjugal transfer pilus assembly protein TraU
MKSVRELILLLVLVVAVLGTQPVFATPTCTGKFANPITDICWSCMLPIRFGGVDLLSMDQEDTPNPGGSPICACPAQLRVGFKVSFWEPVRRVDVVRRPFCMTSLGGVELDPGFDAPRGARNRQDSADATSFYQVHWYVDPIIFWLEAIFDNSCLEQSSFDVAYLTELDPMWHDDELTFIFNPDVSLFGNLPAKAACAADCVAATAGFPLNSLFWCAGCQGSLYPLDGNVQAHIGGVQASSLEMTRLIAKMHREGLMWAASGEDGLCGYYPQPIMDKTGYKYQMLYPIPQTAKIAGKCCQPLGRSTILWGAGKEYPFDGEDFAYMIFRKRNCCQGAF